MPPVTINPIRLPGPWTDGYALDKHSLGSTFLGYDGDIPRFDTERTELGSLLYRLKYRADRSVVTSIAETVQNFIRTKPWDIDCIVPAPPSSFRAFQPVFAVVEALSARIAVPVSQTAILKTKPTPQMKNLEFPGDRAKVLADAFTANQAEIRNRRILLLDDLFEFGSTVGTLTRLLQHNGAAAVYMVALTKKRT